MTIFDLQKQQFYKAQPNILDELVGNMKTKEESYIGPRITSEKKSGPSEIWDRNLLQ